MTVGFCWTVVGRRALMWSNLHHWTGVCVFVCMCVSVCMCVCVYDVCVCLSLSLSLCVCDCVCYFSYSQHTHTTRKHNTNTHTHIHKQHTNTHTYTHKHTQTHTHTHTHRVLRNVDVVLLSHPSMSHLGALPYALTKMGLGSESKHFAVYSTYPVYKMVSSHLTQYKVFIIYN